MADELWFVADRKDGFYLGAWLDPEVPFGGRIGRYDEEKRRIAIGNFDRLPPDPFVRRLGEPVLAVAAAAVVAVDDRLRVRRNIKVARAEVRRGEGLLMVVVGRARGCRKRQAKRGQRV